jgi:Ni/Co efflux regulator RcnB
VPRVNGVPQEQPAPTARRHYEQTQPAYTGQYYDPRTMGNRDARDWERYREGRYYYGARGPEWRRGAHIPREYMGRQYWVEDWRAHRLAPPPRGYQWVQVGNDYVLVALATGIIAQLLLAQ